LLRVSDWIIDRIRLAIPEQSKRQRIGNQIKAATVFARVAFMGLESAIRHGVERVSIRSPLNSLSLSVRDTNAIINAGKRPISRQIPPVTRPRTSETIANTNAANKSGSDKRKKNAGLTSGAKAATNAHAPPIEAGVSAQPFFFFSGIRRNGGKVGGPGDVGRRRYSLTANRPFLVSSSDRMGESLQQKSCHEILVR
jgi:hypothetical protein